MTKEITDQLYAEVLADYGTKNKRLGFIGIIACVAIIIFSVYISNYMMLILALPCILLAVIGFRANKQFSQKFPKDSIEFRECVCTDKKKIKTTQGRQCSMVFDGNIHYDLSFHEEKLFDKSKEGDHFILALDKNTGKIMKFFNASKYLPECEKEAVSAANAPQSKTAPALSVNLRNIIDQDDAPIIVADMMHRIVHLNPAAKALPKFADLSETAAQNVFDFYASENVVTIQKALTLFAESENNNKSDGWTENDPESKITIMALRDDQNHLTGYYLKYQ